MINENSILTKENEFVKNIILNNYNHDNISLAYGCFYIPNGRFSFGKNVNNEDVAFSNLDGNILNIVLDSFSETEIKRVLDTFGLQKIQEQKNEKPKEEKQFFTLFDFM